MPNYAGFSATEPCPGLLIGGSTMPKDAGMCLTGPVGSWTLSGGSGWKGQLHLTQTSARPNGAVVGSKPGKRGFMACRLQYMQLGQV